MWRGAALVLVVLVVILAAIWALQRRLIYLPSQAVPHPPEGVEEVSYTTEDGLELDGWLVLAADPRGAVLVFPGNAGNRAARLPLGRALTGLGFTTLLVDYRGYGGNPGSPSEEGLARDARAALSYLGERYGFDSDRIAYFGESLGSGVAVQLAQDEPPAALILRSPFPSLGDVGSVHYPVLPVSLLLRDRFDNAEKLPGVEAPLLVIAGSADRIVPTRLSRNLYEMAKEPKELVIVDGADHNDFALLAGDEMITAMERFLGDVSE